MKGKFALEPGGNTWSPCEGTERSSVAHNGREEEKVIPDKEGKHRGCGKKAEVGGQVLCPLAEGTDRVGSLRKGIKTNVELRFWWCCPG